MSLYLKYRPDNFESLEWQDFIKDTLKRAIAENKTVGAYLLCWPRGTGKTTTARLLAKTINCLNTKDGNPCLECDICKDFSDERLIDIIEIDAASHTWVDNIREIIERAQFTPTKTQYKIYIIDEVHMLSKWAFNALLKILEEPPKHVKFILATTETHKVPETIISRCQRYDFKRINGIDIKKRLDFIAKQEWVKIDEKSISYIINNSNWWLRNAISLFEQFISDGEINYDDLVRKLWIVWKWELEDFLEKLLWNNDNVIEDLDKLISDWKNIKLFFRELLFFIKEETLRELKKWNDIKKYISILDILDETFRNTKNTLDENTTFIIWILKIISNFSESCKVIKENKEQKKEIIKNIPCLTSFKEEKESQKDEISANDVSDLFNEEENKISTKMNIGDFISKLKVRWAKWSLTMALRWSYAIFTDIWLIITPSTKITRLQIENSENQNLILEILKEEWLWKLIIK